MEEYYQPEALREALIIAGLKEIEIHGLTDFSPVIGFLENNY